jgi:RecB family exonuclease
MTRAKERLIVSGSVGGSVEASDETPIGWVLDRLGLRDAVGDGAVDGPVEVDRGAATVLLRVDRGQPDPAPSRTADPAPPMVAANGQLALFEGSGEAIPARAPRLHDLGVVAEPPLHRVARLSYSALSLFERCSYRYYAERVAGMRPAPWNRSSGDGNGSALPALHATELGDAVHRVLERVDLARPAVPADLRELVGAWYPAASEAETEQGERLVRAYCDSTLAARLAELDGVRVERPFAFEVDDVLLNGRFDVLWRSGSEALVLDYKTNALDARPPVAVVEDEYRLQRIVYALACFRAGADDVEVAYQFLEAPEDIVSERFARADVERLERELAAVIARIRDGDFRPTPSAFACSGCPALDRVCAGPGLALVEV